MRRCTQNSDEAGFTLLELLAAMLLSLIVVATALAAILGSRNAFLDDLNRIGVNRNLRSGLDIIGIAAREAGENLAANFPAVELSQGANGSELIIRRNLLDEVLKLCTPISAGSSNNQLYFAVSGSIQGCIRDDQLHNFTQWQNYRTAMGGTVRAYVFDSASKEGEFFNLMGEVDTGDELYVVAAAHTWGNDYSAVSGAIFMLEEWRFGLEEDILTIVENGSLNNPLSVVDQISDFNVSITMNDGSVVTDLGASGQWTEIRSINVFLAAREVATARGDSNYQAELSSTFFPRNILSH